MGEAIGARTGGARTGDEIEFVPPGDWIVVEVRYRRSVLDLGGIAAVRGARGSVDCRGKQDHAVFMEQPVSLTPAKLQSLLKELRASLEEQYGDDLLGIRLFGSYARRQATPDSDVDILLVLREISDYGTEVRRVRDLLSRVSLECGKTIVPVFVDAKRFSAAPDPFMANIAREAVPA